MRTEDSREDIIIDIRGLKKKYRLGKIGANTLQGAIKERRMERKNRLKGESEGNKALSGSEFYALDGIDLTVKRGETLGIIGRNGAGKSTLLKILSRITAPTEGTVDLYGRVASMLEVGTGFHGDMTGRENIYLNGAILGMKKAEIESKMDDIISFSEVEDFIDTPVKRYSSGMFVKLGFSVAIHLDSEIVIMDEVLAVGDVEFQNKCVNRLLDAAKNHKRTVLFVSHNMHSIRQLCDRCIVLDKGKIIFDGDVDRAIAVYLGVEESLPAEIEFGPEYRPNDALIRLNKLFTIERLKLLSSEKPVFADGDEAVLSITCFSERDLAGVCFRFEIWSQDGTKIASALSGSPVDIDKGRSSIRITMPFTHLVAGQYRADLVAFRYDESGIEYMIDAVYPAFLFQVEQELNDTNYVDWHHKYWGEVRLHDLKVETEPTRMSTR